MEINALRTFLEVAKTHHFGQAAKTLHVSQSTVSARIKTLEEELGVELFIRERGNIRLSPHGEDLINHAKSMMTLWARAKQEISSPLGARQKVVFGGLSGLWDITLQQWLLDISSAHPELAFSADIFSSDTLVTSVLNGSIDVAFLYDAPQGVNIASRQLKPIQLRLVCSKQVAGLAPGWEKNFVQVDWGTNYAVQFATEFPEISGSRITTGLGRIAQQHISRTMGYAYLAETAVQTAVEAGELYYVPGAPAFLRYAYAIYHQESDKVSLIQKLIENL